MSSIFFMFRYSLVIFILLVHIACSDEVDTSSKEETAHAPKNMESLQIQTPMDRPLVQTSRWESDSDQESEEVTSHLVDLYTEMSSESMSLLEEGHESSNDDCHECGRETGFLPTPVITIDGFTELSEKEADFILLSWEEVPNATTYQLIKVQVSESFSEVNKAVNTDTLELGLSLDYGYAYLLYLVAYDDIDKVRSNPSDPILIYCLDSCQLLPY